MPTFTSAFCASIRLANFPSVWCNALTGFAISLLASGSSGFFSPLMVSVLLASSGLYIAGNLLNDWWDRNWDRMYRPERALPSGLVKPSCYLILALFLAACSIVLTCLLSLYASVVSGLIFFGILFYTVLHKRTSLALIPMGICRAALPWLGFFVGIPEAVVPTLTAVLCVTWFSFAVFVHTVSISYSTMVLARTAISTVFLFLIGMLASAFAVVASVLLSHTVAVSVFSSIPYIAAILLSLTASYRLDAGVRVSWLLACFPLLDAILLIPLSLLLPQPSSTVVLIAPPVCFVFACWLQRHTPAT